MGFKPCQYQLSAVLLWWWEKHHWMLMSPNYNCVQVSLSSLSCMWWPARNSVSVVLLTGTWPLLPFPRSQSRAWSYNYQTHSTNQGSVLTRPDQSELRARTTGLLAFTVSELSLVWSLVMGDYSIPGSQSVCVTGESFYPLPPPPSTPLPSVFYCHTNCRFYCQPPVTSQHQISTSGADIGSRLQVQWERLETRESR